MTERNMKERNMKERNTRWRNRKEYPFQYGMLGKIWKFIWHEDSLASWLVNIGLAFILIKYAFYPLVGMFLGTSYPIVAVVSESMEHEPENGILCGRQFTHLPASLNTYWQACGSWYEERNITVEQFHTFPFRNGFSKGDIIILWQATPENINVGDILVFQGERPQPIIHRVVQIHSRKVGEGKTTVLLYQTKGDHNSNSIPGDQGEMDIPLDRIHGKGILRIPYLGWIKVGFVEVMGLFGVHIQR